MAALRALLDEIDTQGGPQAARHQRLHLDERTPELMTISPLARPTPPVTDVPLKNSAEVRLREPEAVPVGKLLKWGDDHPDADIRDQAARARASLTGLRRRHSAEAELTAIGTEAQQLERRLAELRAREAELAPPKARKKPQRDYDPATVRAWAQRAGVDCPPRGRIPKDVAQAWRASLPQTG
ncbi:MULTISPECIES: Lsr2 family DNA-binding protein [Streptomyces]